MNTALKIGGYTLGLLAVFGAAVGIGAAVTPTATSAATSSPTPGDHTDMSAMTTAPAANSAPLPGGLMVSQDGYTLRLADRSVQAGSQVPLRFQILGPDGVPVTGYQTEHDKDLHLIAVRRDLSHFQHVHPVLDPEGTWSVPLDLAASGEYRVFADFTPADHDGGLVLGADLAVPGTYEPAPLPEPTAVAQVVDGYEVTLAGDLVPGRSSELTLTVSKDGVPVTTCSPTSPHTGTWSPCAPGTLPTCTSIPRANPPTVSPPPDPASPSTPPRPRPVNTGCSWTSSTPGSSGPPSSPSMPGKTLVPQRLRPPTRPPPPPPRSLPPRPKPTPATTTPGPAATGTELVSNTP